MKLVYEIENLCCPNCAAKIEAGIQKLDCVEEASLSYATMQLHVTAAEEDGLLERIQAVADGIEDGVVFRKKGAGQAQETHRHEGHHDHDCEDCHDHHDHAHSHEESHDHDHAHSHEHGNTEVMTLVIGAVLFVLGILAEWFLPGILSKGLLLAAYLVMGLEILLSSAKSIGKGQIFDENFLMSVATIGALCIGSWEEAAGVIMFFRIGELFEHMAVEKSRRSVMEAIDMRPETVQRITDGEPEEVPAEDIRVGDRILVRAGDRIPIDGTVLKGESAVDTSAMTGEPVPVSVKPGDAVMSGCINLDGVLELETTAELQDSMVQRVLDSVENAAAGKPKLDRFITRFARIYTPIVVGIALLTAIVPPLFSGEWGHWIYTALNFLMISCPCALVLSVPLAFFSGIGAGSVKGILFKDGISLEALARIQAVVMDKTGTLTKGSFSVTEVQTEGSPEALIRYAAACESFSTHPVAKSILRYAEEQGIAFDPADSVQEIAGKGIAGMVEGKRIAAGNEKLMAAEGVSVPDGERAGTCVYIAADGKYQGVLVLSDTLKDHAAETVQAMNRRGLYTVMLTGDSPAHTKAVSDALGIAETHAGLLPTEKPEHMEAVRKAHGAVLFVGDGINDAPVLSGADVGAAMGSGADAAMEAADVVLLGSDPQSILTAVEIAERVNKTAKFCIIFALAVKIGIMLAGFLGFANMWLSVFADTGVTILCVMIVLWRIHFYYRKKS